MSSDIQSDEKGRDERSWLECEDRLAEALFRLSHEIRESRRASAAQHAWFREHMESITRTDLERTKQTIMAKLSELAGILTAVKDQAVRAKDEILKKIADLETALGDAEIPAEATAALEALKSEVQGIDDIAEAKG